MNALSHSFDPTQDNARDFRNALGRFGTGVTIVTCATRAGPLGMTANSFASVSLDPPLVLWSPAKSSARYAAFAAAEHFAIHVASSAQSDLCASFARSGTAFDQCDWQEGAHNVPLLHTCLSRFECTKVAEYDGGDHAIIVGRVRRVTTGDGDPLLFYNGRFGGFKDVS